MRYSLIGTHFAVDFRQANNVFNTRVIRRCVNFSTFAGIVKLKRNTALNIFQFLEEIKEEICPKSE